MEKGSVNAASPLPTVGSALLTPTVAEIDLQRLWSNAELFRRTAPGATLMAVVKADAYGHGAPQVARHLSSKGVEWFGVATLAEAVELRNAGIDERILVFAAPLPEYLPAYAKYELDVTVSSLDVAQAVAGQAARSGRYRVHVKVDTGMGRIGMSPSDIPAAMALLEHSPQVRIEGLWTHLATADDDRLDFAHRQLEIFRGVLATYGDAAAHVHAATSSAVLRIPESFDFDRAIIRTGIGLYGYSAREGLAETAGLQPVMRLISRVTHTKWVDEGTSISYDRRWQADRRTRIATIAAGYADGYPRLLTNRGEITIRGKRCPVAGTICMDMLMVDVGSDIDVAVGDEAVLFGEGAPDAFEVATLAGTIPYEILTSVTKRVVRVYL